MNYNWLIVDPQDKQLFIPPDHCCSYVGTSISRVLSKKFSRPFKQAQVDIHHNLSCYQMLCHVIIYQQLFFWEDLCMQYESFHVDNSSCSIRSNRNILNIFILGIFVLFLSFLQMVHRYYKQIKAVSIAFQA